VSVASISTKQFRLLDFETDRFSLSSPKVHLERRAEASRIFYRIRSGSSLAEEGQDGEGVSEADASRSSRVVVRRVVDEEERGVLSNEEASLSVSGSTILNHDLSFVEEE